MLSVGEIYFFEDGWSFEVRLGIGKGSNEGTDFPVFLNEDGEVRVLGWNDDEIVVTDEFKIEHAYCMTAAENETYQAHYNTRRFGEHKFDDGRKRRGVKPEDDVYVPEDLNDPKRGVATDDEMYDSGGGGQ
jgi:hypothetical protein